MALGDSLTAGYGLADQTEGFVPVLEGWLKAKGHDVAVQNAGVSGDTTAGGLRRLKHWLTQRRDCLGEEAAKFGITPPRGMLMLGVLVDRQAADVRNRSNANRDRWRARAFREAHDVRDGCALRRVAGRFIRHFFHGTGSDRDLARRR